MAEYNLDFQLIKNLIDNMPMCFYALDENWKFLMSNCNGLEKFGVKTSEAIGISAKVIFKGHQDVLNAFGTALTGKSVHTEHKLGETYVEHFIIPNFNNNGKIIGIYGAIVDITNHKRLENELNQVRNLQDAIMESAPGMVYIYDSDAQLILWNKNHERMTGYTSEELYKFKMLDWFEGDEESIQAVINGLSKIQEEGVVTIEATLQTKDKQKIPFMFTACSVDIGEGEIGTTGIGVDITQLKQIQSELIELNEKLENKVAERTKKLAQINNELLMANNKLAGMNEELTAMNEELMNKNETITQMQDYLVEAEKMKALGGLVAGVAHEINTPIGVGITASTYLVEEIENLNREMAENKLTRHEMVKHFDNIAQSADLIYRNLDRAGELIQNFKQLSVDQSTEPIREFDVGEYLKQVLITLSPALKKSSVHVELNVGENIVLNGNPGAFSQIVSNLVMNAIHHAFSNDESGNIVITLSQEEERVKLVFEDDGNGIDENVLKRIYEPFYTTKRTHGGSGLGLSIVYSIVQHKFKGTIACQSSPGNGTKFTLYI